ncbi:hypothetical protein HY772_08345 [Candidatus Woesearchaeota archaeon]|nr:hypothetical protein [Candidatus Woesearchaeota archaeon]
MSKVSKKRVFFLTLLLSPFILAACNIAAPPTASTPQTNLVFPQKPAEQLYVKAKDRDFSFSYPQWAESEEMISKNAIVQVSQDGCSVFLEATNVSYSAAFDSTLKFLKSGQGKEVKMSNATRGIIEHAHWNKDRTQTFFSTTKFKACNEFIYVVTTTCNMKKIDAGKREVFETVINSVKCANSAREPKRAEAPSANEGVVEKESKESPQAIRK